MLIIQRSAGAALLALVLALWPGAVLGQHLPELDDEIVELAMEAGVGPWELLGATFTTGLPAREYLYQVGHLERPRPALNPAVERRVECVIRYESQGNPRAVNPRSGASGLGQFLPSTWRTTSQGRAGYSVFDPAANRAAVRWMIEVGRAREFDVVRVYGC